MKPTNRRNSTCKHVSTTHKLLTTATAAFLFFGPSVCVIAQTTFQGSLNNVSITDAAGSNSPPTAKFTYTKNGDIFTFDASGSYDLDGSITQYKWDFGNGAFAQGETAIYQMTENLDFMTTLTVVDDKKAISITSTVVNPFSVKGLTAAIYWGANDSKYLDFPANKQLTGNGGAKVSLNYNVQSGDTNAYDRWFRIGEINELINLSSGRLEMKFLATDKNKYIFRAIGQSNGHLNIVLDINQKLIFNYRYSSVSTISTVTLNEWHTLIVWWDGSNDIIGISVDGGEESISQVSGSDLAGNISSAYIGGYSGSNGVGYITDLFVWNNKEGK